MKFTPVISMSSSSVSPLNSVSGSASTAGLSTSGGVGAAEVQSPHSSWQASKIMLRDNELKVDLTSSGICRIPAHVNYDISFHLFRDEVCTRLPTNGNGKCGLHAVFGQPTASGALKVASEAELIRCLIPSDIVAMKNKLSVRGQEILNDVTSGTPLSVKTA